MTTTKTQQIVDRGGEALAVALEKATEQDAMPVAIAEHLIALAQRGGLGVEEDITVDGDVYRVRLAATITYVGRAECRTCRGSGEGLHETSLCRTCGGSGYDPGDGED